MTKRNQKKQSKPKQQVKTVVKYVDKPMSFGAMAGDWVQKTGLPALAKVSGLSHVAKLLGMGDYKIAPGMDSIKTNALFNNPKNMPVSFSTGLASFVFEHSEYICDIKTSADGSFKADTFVVNPSEPETFPWLSNLAASFDQYEVEGLVFRFVSTSGEVSTNTTTNLGSVMAYFSYDTSDSVPNSKQILLQYDGCMDVRPTENFLLGVECDPKLSMFNNTLLVGPVPAGNDPHLYNKGKFMIATQGCPTNISTVGELHVSYRIRFKIAHLPSNLLGNPSESINISFTASSGQAFGTLIGQSSRSLIASGSGNVITISNLTIGNKYCAVITQRQAAAATYTVNSFAISGGSILQEFIYPGANQTHAISPVSTSQNVASTVAFTANADSVTITQNITSTQSTQGNLLLTEMDELTLP